jgi:hypothetical protein
MREPAGHRRATSERGATTTEYLMIAGLSTAMIIIIFTVFYWESVSAAAPVWVRRVNCALSGSLDATCADPQPTPAPTPTPTGPATPGPGHPPPSPSPSPKASPPVLTRQFCGNQPPHSFRCGVDVVDPQGLPVSYRFGPGHTCTGMALSGGPGQFIWEGPQGLGPCTVEVVVCNSQSACTTFRMPWTT